MERIVVYSTDNSNRLKYVLDWLFRERLQLDYTIVHDTGHISPGTAVISYGNALPGSISVPAHGLLWQKGTSHCKIEASQWNDIPVFFSSAESGYTLPFDIFSAIFYLISRYEEYEEYRPDKHNRFPAGHSVLHKNGWLQRPLADEWVHAFRKVLQPALGHAIESAHFVFCPTYDIDMAYSHLHKGAGRIVGAYVRALLRGDVKQISERTQVLKNKQKDPYDSFRWLRQLHREYDVKPLYFVLASHKTTAFDKNIHPNHPAMMRVIKNLAKDGTIGSHPSYYSDNGDTVSKEIRTLEHISGRKVHISRQHYIKFRVPETCRILLHNGITDDYSMGYGSHLGFRAGTGNSFLWYDMENETVSTLRLHPFCFMDTTAHFEVKLSVSEAFEKLDAMCKILQRTGSTLVTVFHNFSLGTSNEWKGWKQAYEHFLQEKINTPVHENT